MNYIRIDKDNLLNGDGIRVVLWCSGCSCHCKNCFNPETWDKNAGQLFDDNAKQEIFKELKNDYVQGLSLLGGHPLEEYNLAEVTQLCKEIKEKYPNKDIWCWTGFIWEKVQYYEVIQYIDVLIDGAYIEEQRNTALKWRGSTNQRVIDVKKSLEENKIILYCD